MERLEQEEVFGERFTRAYKHFEKLLSELDLDESNQGKGALLEALDEVEKALAETLQRLERVLLDQRQQLEALERDLLNQRREFERTKREAKELRRLFYLQRQAILNMEKDAQRGH